MGRDLNIDSIRERKRDNRRTKKRKEKLMKGKLIIRSKVHRLNIKKD